MRFLMQTRTVALAALAALPAGLGAPAAHAAPATPAAALVLADCRLTPPGGVTGVAARCGTLEVPEDYARPQGKRIRLAVAVVPALDRAARQVPVAIIAGGPGQGSRGFYASVAPAFERVRRTRDLVLVDQRGTGDSNLMKCGDGEEEGEDGGDALDGMLADTEVLALTRACLGRLPGDPRFYTTSVAVRDLDAVRAALGYAQLNLYGVSYGTRVAQHYAQRHPAQARALVIDGVVPPGLALGPDLALVAQRAIDAAFARCARDRDCAAAYPDLATRFAALVADLRLHPREVSLAHPVTGKPVTRTFNIAQLAGAVRLLSYTPLTLSVLPYLLDEATKGRPAPLLAQAIAVGDSLGDELAEGMHNAVVCTEDMPFVDQAGVDRAALGRTYIGVRQLDTLATICGAWPRGVMDADLRKPLAGKVPVLLLSGEVDPVTPPAYAEQARKSLTDALHVVVPGNGHGQLGVPCTPRVLATFFDAATTRGLDTACLKDASRALPFFLDANGPSP